MADSKNAHNSLNREELVDDFYIEDPLDEADFQAINTRRKVKKALPPHLTHGLPDSVFTKKLHELNIIPAGIIAYSGDEEGNAEGKLDEFQYYAFTENGIDSGKKRKKKNDDGFLIDPDSKTLIVTDGVSSGGLGQIASNIALHKAAIYLDSMNKDGKKDYPLDMLLHEMNHSVVEFQDNNPNLDSASTTVVAAKINENNTVDIAYAGDSKALIIRGDKVVFATLEETQLQYEMFKQKKTERTLKQELVDNKYWAFRSTILQCLGHHANAINWQTPTITSRDINPHYQNLKVEKDDVLLLCSDGLSDNLTDEEIAWSINKSLKMGKSLKEAIEQLKGETLYKMKDYHNGKGDNLTIIGVQI